jgi:signal transduction histidine kinase
MGLSGEESVLVSREIKFGDRQFHILVEGPVSESLAAAANTFRIMLAIVVIAFLAAGVFGLLTVRKITRPIEDIADTARAINAGDLSCRVAVNGNDEFGVLGTAFNRMTSQLEALISDLEKRVAERTAELAASNQELESFAYSVSHDLRAPLRHIDGFLDLLRQKIGTGLDEQGLRFMDTISASAQKMGQLIDDLLSFSRMGRQALSFSRQDLKKIVSSVIKELEPDIAGRTISWRIEELPVIKGDGPMLRIVFSNLISNAIKFSREKEEALIEIGCRINETENCVFIRDNGVGFDQDYTDRLFGVFQRLHRSDEFEGTGVGLAIVHRIISRHGGRIWAEGESGKGATFYFSLPLESISSAEESNVHEKSEAE